MRIVANVTTGNVPDLQLAGYRIVHTQHFLGQKNTKGSWEGTEADGGIDVKWIAPGGLIYLQLDGLNGGMTSGTISVDHATGCVSCCRSYFFFH